MWRLLRAVLSGATLTAAAWRLFVLIQGDSRIEFTSDRLERVRRTDDGLTGVVELRNVGRQCGILRRVDARIDAPRRVRVTRQESRPHERGWWVSNILEPGESCAAEVDVVFDHQPEEPLFVELETQEIGRGLIVKRSKRLAVPLPS